MPHHPVRPPEWIDVAPMSFSNSIDIDAPPAEVWARVIDHTSWPEWFTALDSVEVTGAASGVGGRRRATVRRLPLDEEFTVWDENARFAFAVVHTRFFFLDTLVEDVRITPTDTGCSVSYRQGIAARRGFGWLAKLVFGTLGGQTGDALERLKTLTEQTDEGGH